MDFGNIGMLILIVIGGLAGLGSTLYIVVSFPAVIIWKIIRRTTKGIPLTK